MKKILIVVDMQNDFINGSLGTKEAQMIVPDVVKKIKKYTNEDALILFTKDTHYDNYLETLEGKKLPVKHCIKDTDGWDLNAQIEKCRRNVKKYNYIIDNVIIKNTFGSDILERFIEANKDDIEEIEFCGLCTDICVISNVLMARQKMPNTKIVVDASCCAGVTIEKHKAAIEAMKSCQIDIINE